MKTIIAAITLATLASTASAWGIDDHNDFSRALREQQAQLDRNAQRMLMEDQLREQQRQTQLMEDQLREQRYQQQQRQLNPWAR